VRWSIPLIGYVAVTFQNHRGPALHRAGIVLIVFAVTMVSGSRRRSARRDEGDEVSMGSGNPRRGTPHAGDAERPPPVPCLAPGIGQDGTQ